MRKYSTPSMEIVNLEESADIITVSGDETELIPSGF